MPKSASKVAPAVAAPKTPVERTRSNDWASLSATAPEPVVTSPAVGSELSSSKDTFPLQDLAAKDKADVITPSFEMSTPAEEVPQTEKSLFSAPLPPGESSSSWGNKISGFAAPVKPFGFGRLSGRGTPAAAAPEKASSGWGLGSFDVKDSSAGAGAGGGYAGGGGASEPAPLAEKPKDEEEGWGAPKMVKRAGGKKPKRVSAPALDLPCT
ncbi:hypothetical protein FIBSPDRAFT_395512 [Athelia psychrophila]|uniref:Uncharacterized protein n=1 Tax=Athelia psychrophila TaxID=1759441 RepID=A0A166NN31_9AGAM|nr:hypothetical protein FIBSPDRAFT_395512 [Fibularhizoctonia sp. CBS 109695]